ncbi:MAG: hypothetical protein WCN98_09495 [Verrucomicrobiaceae bacterium]
MSVPITERLLHGSRHDLVKMLTDHGFLGQLPVKNREWTRGRSGCYFLHTMHGHDPRLRNQEK